MHNNDEQPFPRTPRRVRIRSLRLILVGFERLAAAIGASTPRPDTRPRAFRPPRGRPTAEHHVELVGTATVIGACFGPVAIPVETPAREGD